MVGTTTTAGTESGGSVSSLLSVDVAEVNYPQMTISEITSGVTTGGSGIFDQMMDTLKKHLDDQWDSGRITGHEYATVFTDLYQNTLQSAIAYANSRARLPYEIQALEYDNTYKMAQIEIARAELAKQPFQIDLIKAQTDQVIAETTLTGVRTQAETANLAKIPLEEEILRKEALKADASISLTTKQVEQLTAEITKIPLEVEILGKQRDNAQAQLEQTEAQTDRITQETLLKLPIEVENLTKQGLQLAAETTLTANQAALSALQATKVPVEIEVMQADIVYKAKQNLILEREYEIKLVELNIQEKNLELADAELELRREELNVKLAQIEAQEAQSALYRQKVVTERAQTDNTAVGTGSVIDLSNQVLAAQVKGYTFDAQNRLAKLMVDTFSVTYQQGDRTVNTDNKLTDAHIGSVFTKMFADLDIT